MLVGLGPVLWLVFARAPFGRSAATVLKIGVLTALVSVWWVMGLAVQGGYGIPILRYTMTLSSTGAVAYCSR